jgi:hypothetical protein
VAASSNSRNVRAARIRSRSQRRRRVRLSPRPSRQRLHEALGVEAAHGGALQKVGAGAEVVGHRDGDRGLHERFPRIAELAEQLEQRVAAEREADGAARACRHGARPADAARARCRRVAGMIEARRAVRLAAARAEVEADGADAARGQLAVGVDGIAAACGSLEAVQQQHERAHGRAAPPRRDGRGRRSRRPAARSARARTRLAARPRSSRPPMVCACGPASQRGGPRGRPLPLLSIHAVQLPILSRLRGAGGASPSRSMTFDPAPWRTTHRPRAGRADPPQQRRRRAHAAARHRRRAAHLGARSASAATRRRTRRSRAIAGVRRRRPAHRRSRRNIAIVENATVAFAQALSAFDFAPRRRHPDHAQRLHLEPADVPVAARASASRSCVPRTCPRVASTRSRARAARAPPADARRRDLGADQLRPHSAGRRDRPSAPSRRPLPRRRLPGRRPDRDRRALTPLRLPVRHRAQVPARPARRRLPLRVRSHARASGRLCGSTCAAPLDRARRLPARPTRAASRTGSSRGRARARDSARPPATRSTSASPAGAYAADLARSRARTGWPRCPAPACSTTGPAGRHRHRRVPGHDAATSCERLREQAIGTSAPIRDYAVIDMDAKGAGSALRISPHYYNTRREIDILVARSRSSHNRVRYPRDPSGGPGAFSPRASPGLRAGRAGRQLSTGAAGALIRGCAIRENWCRVRGCLPLCAVVIRRSLPRQQGINLAHRHGARAVQGGGS